VRRFYHALESFPLLSIPLYIMLGVLADRAKMLPELVVWLQMIFGRLRGGMAYINSVAAMLFSGISGTAVSDIASLGRPLIQLMTRAGYPLTYSAALTAATSIIGPVIPPSVGHDHLRARGGNISVGAMFAGAMIPGIIMGLGFMAMSWHTTRKGRLRPHLSRRRPHASSGGRRSRSRRSSSSRSSSSGASSPGIFTVTESAAVGTAYTIIVAS
jgi:TRAP-type C4-dicarboxylate transport system permease large subunit